jgi:4-hydroxy-3-polyprenylbenzoate decarboxylase
LPDLADARQISPRLLLASIRKGRSGHARDAMRKLWGAGVPEDVVLVVFDADVDVQDAGLALFHATANLDPARDTLRDGAKLGFDATVKRVDEGAREWPPIIRMDDATKALVDKRWPDYGL